MRQAIVVFIFGWMSCLIVHAQLPPVPESKQAAQALAIIDAYKGARPAIPPKKLYIVYFTPADRDPAPQYESRLTAIMEDIQSFYRGGMERTGFGPETFPLERDTNSNLVIHLVKGKESASGYSKPDSEKICRECEPSLKAAGISFDRDTILIFCNLADWDAKAKTFSHHSPYYGMWDQTSGLCFAADSSILNLADVPRKSPRLQDDEYGEMSLGKFNTIFIGGIAHELGHAFALPHCGERWDQKTLGTSLMGVGNHTYREERRGDGKGTFLTMASALHLAGRPLFNGSDKGMTVEPGLQQCEFTLSTNVTDAKLIGRHATLRVAGTVVGTPPVYGVIAYFDSWRDGGYHAPTATSVPDAQGRFAIEVSDLAPCGDGELRLEFLHANGGSSERRAGFRVDMAGDVDLSQWQQRQALEPMADAVVNNRTNEALAALQKLEASDESAATKKIGRTLAATLASAAKPRPVEVPDTIADFALGDAQPESAQVGWLEPAANRVPLNNEVTAPFLDSGKLYATGFYAHAPSRYVFNLGGKWKKLHGEAGLHTLHQPFGSVIFVIKADGREVFRSAIIKGDKKAGYDLNVEGVKQLELIVEPAADNNHNDWGLWLDPTLSR